MRDYARVSPCFWTGETGRKVRTLGVEAQLIALYLITSPHASMIGLYYLPVTYISHATGIPLEGALEGLQSLSEASFCYYDEKTEFVYIPEMARYQIGEELKANDNRIIGINRELRNLSNNPFLLDFYAKYRDIFHLDCTEKIEGALKGLASPSEAKNKNKRIKRQNLLSKLPGFDEIPDPVSDESKIESVVVALDRCPFQKIIAAYHEHCPGLPKIVKLTESLKTDIRNRYANGLPSLEAWQGYFKSVADSDFLSGRVNEFRADLHWLVKAGNFSKVINGKFVNRQRESEKRRVIV